MIKPVIFFIVVCLLISACDSMRRIDMKNSSGQDAEIIWTLKDMDSLYKSPFFLSNSKKVKFKLKKDSPYNEANMSFGTGVWTKEALDSITERLDSLEIRSSSGTITMGSDEMNKYLKERRKGLGKRKIALVIPK